MIIYACLVVFDPTRYSYHQKLFLIKFYFKLFQLTVTFWVKFNKIYFENYTVINGHLNSNVYKAVETNAFMKNFSQLAKLIDKSWRYNTRPEQQLVDLYWKICASASICFFKERYFGISNITAIYWFTSNNPCLVMFHRAKTCISPCLSHNEIGCSIEFWLRGMEP